MRQHKAIRRHLIARRMPLRGIGPHEGRELELMLCGRKGLAMFTDWVPEEDFAPHVATGRLIRWETVYRGKRRPTFLLRTVYFATRREAWRIDRAHRLRSVAWQAGWTEATEREIGRLLGYTFADVGAYLQRSRRFRRLVR